MSVSAVFLLVPARALPFLIFFVADAAAATLAPAPAALAGVDAITSTDGLTITDRCQSKSSLCPLDRRSKSWSTPESGLVGNVTGEVAVDTVVGPVPAYESIVAISCFSGVAAAGHVEAPTAFVGAAGLCGCIRATKEKKSSSAEATAAASLASSGPDGDGLGHYESSE